MNYKITLTEQAEADLRSIFEYIAFKLLSPENAIDIRNKKLILIKYRKHPLTFYRSKDAFYYRPLQAYKRRTV